MVQAQIGHNSVDPGVKRAFETEADQVAIGLQKGLLVNVLRVLLRGGQAQSKTKYGMVILAHQFLEGRAIAALRLAYQDVIVNAPQCLADHVSPKGGCIRGTARCSHHVLHNAHQVGFLSANPQSKT